MAQSNIAGYRIPEVLFYWSLCLLGNLYINELMVVVACMYLISKRHCFTDMHNNQEKFSEE